ncbi:MAG: hypothetical protein CME61_07450 [Halobacteriovoraceae bacterium]|nr:hypothetical protein [Halobacteriovoraceae bacterium]
MKKFNLFVLGLSLASPLIAMSDEPIKKSVDFEYSAGVNGIGGNDFRPGFELKGKRIEERSRGGAELTETSSMEIKAMPIEIDDNGMKLKTSAVNFKLGTVSKSLNHNVNKPISIITESEYDSLNFKTDGYTESLELLKSTWGAGASLNLSPEVRLSGTGHMGLGFELGKNKGPVDFHGGGKLRFMIKDALEVVSKKEFSFSPTSQDNSSTNSLEISTRVGDNLMLGIESSRSENYNHGIQYKTNYSGVKVGGVW